MPVVYLPLCCDLFGLEVSTLCCDVCEWRCNDWLARTGPAWCQWQNNRLSNGTLWGKRNAINLNKWKDICSVSVNGVPSRRNTRHACWSRLRRLYWKWVWCAFPLTKFCSNSSKWRGCWLAHICWLRVKKMLFPRYGLVHRRLIEAEQTLFDDHLWRRIFTLFGFLVDCRQAASFSEDFSSRHDVASNMRWWSWANATSLFLGFRCAHFSCSAYGKASD